jgi:hypothetical protein
MEKSESSRFTFFPYRCSRSEQEPMGLKGGKIESPTKTECNHHHNPIITSDGFCADLTTDGDRVYSETS